MTDEEIQGHKDDIDKLSREAMCRLWRFTPSGHVYFQYGPVHDHFAKRFKDFGGFSPQISKALGWGGGG